MAQEQARNGGRRRALWITGIAALAGILGGVGVALWFWWSAESLTADPNNPALVALGQTTYAVHCAQCHGAKLEGEPNWRQRKPDGQLPSPPHDATGHTWHHPDDQLFGITKHGLRAYAPPGYKTDMPAYKDMLTDKEIWAVLAYIKSTWPESERRHQERLNQKKGR